jgi:hypothetical protein
MADDPHLSRIDLRVQPVFHTHEIAEGLDINGPVTDYDWDDAMVVVKLPCHSTAVTTVVEVEISLLLLAGLLARAQGTPNLVPATSKLFPTGHPGKPGYTYAKPAEPEAQ